MRDFTTTVINKYNSIIRVMLVLVAITLISLLFTPRTFNFDFEEGKPWRHENLTSPFLFTINKTDVQIENEKQTIRADFLPYYSYEKGVAPEVLRDFQDKYSELYHIRNEADTLFAEKGDSAQMLSVGRKILNEIYNKGIVAKANVALGTSSPENFNLLANNVSELKAYESFNDLKSANYFLVKSVQDRDDINSEFLLDVFQKIIQPNIIYDDEVSTKLLQETLGQVSPTRGLVQSQEMIISSGEIVSPEKYQVLSSLSEAYTEKSVSDNRSLLQRFGYFLFVTLLIGSFLAYVRHYEPEIIKHPRQLSFMLFSMVAVLFIVKLLLRFDDPRILYLFPFCILPIIFRNFFSGGVSLFAYVVLLFITSFLIPLDFEFIIIQFLAGLVAVLVSSRTYYWSQIFSTTAAIFIAYLLTYFSLNLIHSGTGFSFDRQIIAAFGVNALISLLAFPLIPLFERLFGFVSNISLVELGDLNKPLLKQLSQKAPGTFWHSLQVASLAEAVARELGANELLTKVGALYHDVGKMANPGFFIENLENEMNPHDRLVPEESARIIINHVKAGINIAKEHKLPNVLIDFIRTHHGKTQTVFFYERQKELMSESDEPIDRQPFTYPGPLPFNKETAIVMMADGIEAASRTLENPSKSQIDELVENIISNKIALNQFTNCDLSFRDIHVAKKIFAKMLKSKFHIRVQYPDQKVATATSSEG